MDPFTILPQEKSRYLEQFNSLKPVGGFVSGEQAKGYLLQSQLPPIILGQIWDLADMNCDGKLDFTEFSIACKLINLKLRGFEIPKTLPPSLRSSAATAGAPTGVTPPTNLVGVQLVSIGGIPPMTAPSVPVIPTMVAPMVQPMVPLVTGTPAMNISMIPQMNANNIAAVGMMSPPIAATATGIVSTSSMDGSKPNTPDSSKVVRSGSIVSRDSPLLEWAIPHPSKLKYTQLFNSHDRNKTGFLTGVQSRGILVQTQLSQPLLAKIWSLSDVDVDGRLSCEEFVLAMHLCDLAKMGDKLPDVLPPELLPPTFRRPVGVTPSTSIGSIPGVPISDNTIPLGMTSPPAPSDELKVMSPVTFEDKRKENFEKGQAELEKRRRALLEQQRREQEERERKEREEQERKEKIRQEQERRRLAELEKQLAKQRELEMEKEEQRRKMLEQREAARKEMERQRQMEWQKQRLQELQHQKQREQEKLAILRASHKNLQVELMSLDDKVQELSSKIVETRTGVAEAKNTIDGMRTTRDTQLSQLATLKNQLREQNQRLLTVSQEKVRLEAKNRMNATSTPTSVDPAVAQNLAVRQIALKQMKEKLESLQEEITKKTEDVENNNMQLTNLKTELSSLARNCQDLYKTYSQQRQQVLQLRATGGTKKTVDNDWATAVTSSWGVASSPVTTVTASDNANSPGVVRYRALYEFVARNGDEISFQPGDIIIGTNSLSNEPGWLSGEVRGQVGWFPEAYVEKMDNTMIETMNNTDQVITAKRHPLEGIQELPENVSDNGSIADTGVSTLTGTESSSAFTQVKASEEPSSPVLGQGEIVNDVKAEAIYAWQGKKENHLSFMKGDIITVKEEQDMWWFGELKGQGGWFPKSFVNVVQLTPNELSPIANPITSPKALDATEEYVAMYPYESTETGDLTFNAGEIVAVIKKDGDWWTGTIGSRTGVFPYNYVQKAELQYEGAVDSEVEAATAAGAAAATSVLVNNQTTLNGQSTKRPNTAPVESDFESAVVSVPRAASAASSGAASPSGSQPRGSKKPEIATVIAPYTATSNEQLSLQRGQLIMIRKKSPSGWWEGELQAKGRKRQIGWFPASYVKVLSSTGGSSRTTPVPSDSIDELQQVPSIVPGSAEVTAALEAQVHSADQVVALFPYTAQNEDELSFLQGDVIRVIDREDPAWWKGELKGQVGLFPSNYVEVMGSLAASAALGAAASASSTASQWHPKNDILVNLSPVEQKRQIAIQELINTEETYMEDMSVVIEVFKKPMAESGIVAAEDIDAIFVNWNDLMKCNYTFLRALRVRKKMSANGIIESIGDILTDYFPHMSPYIRFCSRQLNAAALLQSRHENVPEFRDLLKRCQSHPKVKGMPLTSYLLKPMQRITKYPLLIKKILESTSKGHADRPNLEDALVKAEELCTQVNEGVREQENSERLEWMQRRVQIEGLDEPLIFNSLTNILGPRKLLHFGPIKKVKSGKELLAFLFNDFLLFTIPSKPLASLNLQFLFDQRSNVTLRMYKKPMLLNEILTNVEGTINGSPQVNGEMNHENETSPVRFTLQNLDYKMVLTSSTAADRILWVRQIEEARKKYLAVERDVFQRQKSIRHRPPQGILRVVIVKGIALAARDSKGKSDPYCEVSLGSQEHRTKVMTGTLNPKWNASMQFQVKDIKQDVLCITVLDRDYFSPNEFLGRTEVRLWEIYEESRIYRGPLIKHLPLHEIETGEVILKLDLQIFRQN